MANSPYSHMTMPFGKYQGKKLKDVPQSYLEWLWKNVPLRRNMRKAVAEILGVNEEEGKLHGDDQFEGSERSRGYDPGSPQGDTSVHDSRYPASVVIERWLPLYRRLAMALHPDKGGDAALMKIVNDFNDFLKGL